MNVFMNDWPIFMILALAGLVQGYCGFAYGITSIALLALLSRPMAPMAAMVNITCFFILVLLLYLSREHGRIRWKQAGLLLAGGAVGSPVGFAFITHMGDRPVFRLALAGYLILAGAMGMRSPNGRKPWPGWMALPTGLFSGFLSGAFVTGGPPIVLYLYSRTDDPREMKATIQFVFIVLTAYRIAQLFTTPQVFDGVLRLSGWGVLAAAGTLVAGHALAKRSSVDLFRRIVNGLIVALGVFIAVKVCM